MNRRSTTASFAAASMLVLAATACNGSLESREGIEVPLYSVQNGAVSEEQASGLREDLGISPEQPLVREDGAIVYLDEEGFQRLPTQATGQSGTDAEEGHAYDVRWLPPEAMSALPEPMSPDEATAQVEGALERVELHPSLRLPQEAGNVTVDTGHSEFEMVDDAGAVVYDRNLDTHVSYTPRLRAGDGMADLIGPGASVKVVLDPEGAATLLHYEMYALAPSGNVWVPTQEQATEQCAESFRSDGGAQPEELQVEAELVYFAPPFSEAPETIYPYYECSGTMQVGGEDGPSETVTLRPTRIQATEEAPAPPRGDPTSERGEPAIETAALGQVDVGTEWVGESQNLGGSQDNAGGFASSFGARTAFNWGDFDAWERDFKDSVTSSGNDDQWVDNVDAVFYTGHANANSFTFPGNRDDGRLRFPEAGWGQRDLEWLVIAACGPLQRTNGSGTSWHARWGSAFRGLHLLMAYANVSNDNEREGRIYARALRGNIPFIPALKVRQAWALAATRVQPSDVTYAYMGVADADWNTNIDDYFWTQGNGGPDIEPGEIAYYWRVSSPS